MRARTLVAAMMRKHKFWLWIWVLRPLKPIIRHITCTFQLKMCARAHMEFFNEFGFLGAKNLYCHVLYVWKIVYFISVQFKWISNQCDRFIFKMCSAANDQKAQPVLEIVVSSVYVRCNNHIFIFLSELGIKFAIDWFFFYSARIIFWNSTLFGLIISTTNVLS